MNRTEKSEEIINQLTAFSNEKYKKSEYLHEMLKFQSQLANIAYKGKNKDARMWDIYNHLNQLNRNLNGIADDELAKFRPHCKNISGKIRSEISGVQGESLTYQTLESIKSVKLILRNVEIEVDGVRTEIDFIVFTEKAIFIIEVKNSQKNIFISNKGEYYYYGQFMRFDCNIKEKMIQREKALMKILNDAGFFKTNIVSLLVFTNNRIEVKNTCKSIDSIFLGQLPYKIDKYNGWTLFTDERIDDMSETIKTAQFTGEYTLDIDMSAVKKDFAELIVALDPENKKQQSFIEKIKTIFHIKKVA